MRIYSALLLLALCALPACSGSIHDSPSAPPRDPAPYTWTNTTEEIDILESVFRYQFEHNASSGTALNRAEYLFLALGESNARLDPPSELMARFVGHIPPVEPASASDTSQGGVTHKQHGGQGILFRIDRLRKIDEQTFDVDGGYWEESLSSSGNSFRVRHRDGKWVVVGEAMWWIS